MIDVPRFNPIKDLQDKDRLAAMIDGLRLVAENQEEMIAGQQRCIEALNDEVRLISKQTVRHLRYITLLGLGFLVAAIYAGLISIVVLLLVLSA